MNGSTMLMKSKYVSDNEVQRVGGCCEPILTWCRMGFWIAPLNWVGVAGFLSPLSWEEYRIDG